MKGKPNGELLRAAEQAGYEALLTVDQGIPHQGNAAGRKLAVLVIRSRTNQLEDLLPRVDAILNALDTIQPGETAVVPAAIRNP